MMATPAVAAKNIKAYTEGAPVKHVHFWASIAGMPEDMVLKHVNTLCTKLRPLIS
jgi:hypothetical protein